MERIATVKLGGNLCYDSNGALLHAVSAALDKPVSVVELDLSDVPMIDSSGVRSLLRARKVCEEADKTLRIGPLSECVSRILAMSGLATMFGLPDTAPMPPVGQTLEDLELRGSQWQIHEHIATSDPHLVSVLRDKATEVAVQAGVTGDDLCDIQIAVGEALANAFLHGSPKRGVSKVTMRCMSCSRALAIEVEDEGEQFDPDAVPEPDPNKMRDHGMGIYLMRMAMDVVEYTFGCPGNRVRMVKWLRPKEQ